MEKKDYNANWWFISLFSVILAVVTLNTVIVYKSVPSTVAGEWITSVALRGNLTLRKWPCWCHEGHVFPREVQLQVHCGSRGIKWFLIPTWTKRLILQPCYVPIPLPIQFIPHSQHEGRIQARVSCFSVISSCWGNSPVQSSPVSRCAPSANRNTVSAPFLLHRPHYQTNCANTRFLTLIEVYYPFQKHDRVLFWGLHAGKLTG